MIKKSKALPYCLFDIYISGDIPSKRCDVQHMPVTSFGNARAAMCRYSAVQVLHRRTSVYIHTCQRSCPILPRCKLRISERGNRFSLTCFIQATIHSSWIVLEQWIMGTEWGCFQPISAAPSAPYKESFRWTTVIDSSKSTKEIRQAKSVPWWYFWCTVFWKG